MSEDDTGRPAAPLARAVRKVSRSSFLSCIPGIIKQPAGAGPGHRMHTLPHPTEAQLCSLTRNYCTLHHHSAHSVVFALCSGSGRWEIWI